MDEHVKQVKNNLKKKKDTTIISTTIAANKFGIRCLMEELNILVQLTLLATYYDRKLDIGTSDDP